jgi:hypothetical protein
MNECSVLNVQVALLPTSIQLWSDLTSSAIALSIRASLSLASSTSANVAPVYFAANFVLSHFTDKYVYRRSTFTVMIMNEAMEDKPTVKGATARVLQDDMIPDNHEAQIMSHTDWPMTQHNIVGPSAIVLPSPSLGPRLIRRKEMWNTPIPRPTGTSIVTTYQLRYGLSGVSIQSSKGIAIEPTMPAAR